MFASVFNTFFYEPLYNGFIFLISIVPFNDVGIAIVLLTVFVRFLLLPLTHKSSKSQAKIKFLEPEIAQIKKETEHNKQDQAKRVMELYQKHGINPFSGCLLFLVQIPFILALFWIFNKGFTNGLEQGQEYLYSFIAFPENISIMFLGIIDLSKKSFFIALFAGISQYFQIKLAMPSSPAQEKKQTPSFKDEFSKGLQTQMKYVFPVMVFFFSYSIFPSAVALYWITSNVFSITHELFVRNKAKKDTEKMRVSVSSTQDAGVSGSL